MEGKSQQSRWLLTLVELPLNFSVFPTCLCLCIRLVPENTAPISNGPTILVMLLRIVVVMQTLREAIKAPA